MGVDLSWHQAQAEAEGFFRAVRCETSCVVGVWQQHKTLARQTVEDGSKSRRRSAVSRGEEANGEQRAGTSHFFGRWGGLPWSLQGARGSAPQCLAFQSIVQYRPGSWHSARYSSPMHCTVAGRSGTLIVLITDHEPRPVDTNKFNSRASNACHSSTDSDMCHGTGVLESSKPQQQVNKASRVQTGVRRCCSRQACRARRRCRWT